ncbi:hypothetical protein OCO_01030 [Mycobacterium intracellulare MOTT-02]|uniref:Uncharacterized protein n=2 Tax=Mycobacterium intracellulare TaxID=1767 RepID=X8CCS6_MYCIT|nr:hypothetical protein OCO_01030 [Mycobacterium intracellulare MOTT-02]AFC51615.1 hypothetical protein OCQ_01020 [Mycobacterium paraintracellulare]ASW83522.1 hypothetical protein CKJ61_00540 [Mycobacterium intracellulare]ASW98650.1 hypothetical protein CKJ58_01055 [Mycobacterium intracellulare subsp. chimaera]EUA54172.1 hypothetical protein I550_5813 [Mycobacterium intracellulare 1956]
MRLGAVTRRYGCSSVNLCCAPTGGYVNRYSGYAKDLTLHFVQIWRSIAPPGAAMTRGHFASSPASGSLTRRRLREKIPFQATDVTGHLSTKWLVRAVASYRVLGEGADDSGEVATGGRRHRVCRPGAARDRRRAFRHRLRRSG